LQLSFNITLLADLTIQSAVIPTLVPYDLS
jgi:hypothetical protein